VLQVLFEDAERQGVRLRVTAAAKAADAAAQEGSTLHEEFLDRAAYSERLALAGGQAASDGVADGAPAVVPAGTSTRRQNLQRQFSALKPFVIISLRCAGLIVWAPARL
jgi:hypothetical protein